jgi:hypothetical protein
MRAHRVFVQLEHSRTGMFRRALSLGHWGRRRIVGDESVMQWASLGEADQHDDGDELDWSPVAVARRRRERCAQMDPVDEFEDRTRQDTAALSAPGGDRSAAPSPPRPTVKESHVCAPSHVHHQWTPLWLPLLVHVCFLSSVWGFHFAPSIR